MTNRNRAIFGAAWTLMLAGIAVIAILAIHPMGGPRTCTFDGGGTITAGQAARTSDGHVWQCTEDGRLIRIG